MLVTAAVAALLMSVPALRAQSAAAPSAEEIKKDLETIKKGRTLVIQPAPGTDDSSGATQLRIDNTSSFKMIVLIVGPTTQRVELDGERMQTLAVEPGDYEIAVSIVGRISVPPFYGKQKIEPKKFFIQRFVVPVF